MATYGSRSLIGRSMRLARDLSTKPSNPRRNRTKTTKKKSKAGKGKARVKPYTEKADPTNPLRVIRQPKRGYIFVTKSRDGGATIYYKRYWKITPATASALVKIQQEPGVSLSWIGSSEEAVEALNAQMRVVQAARQAIPAGAESNKRMIVTM